MVRRLRLSRREPRSPAHLIAFEKTELAGNASIIIAQAKARMAATYRVPTKVYQDRLAAGETFLLGLPGAIPAAGGVPIVVGGKLIGAIGVSLETAGRFATSTASTCRMKRPTRNP
jgi:glc operon protein GlcG